MYIEEINMKKGPTELFLRTSQIPNSFYNFLNTNLTTYSKTERQIIRTVLSLIYKGKLLKNIYNDKYLEMVFPSYTTAEMITLCNYFVSDTLKSKIGLAETIYELRKKFEKASSV